MELDPSLGGQMQKQVTCNKELLEVCLPMLEGCDAQFSNWYRSKKGPDSIHKLVRLQSFITRYRVNPDESAGLLRHIDGVQVRTGPSNAWALVLTVVLLCCSSVASSYATATTIFSAAAPLILLVLTLRRRTMTTVGRWFPYPCSSNRR
jgi:hypothetical protein